MSICCTTVYINSFNPGIVREREDRFDLKSPTLFIFAEKDAVIPFDQVSYLSRTSLKTFKSLGSV